MHSSTGICLHLPVDANLVYTGRCFFMLIAYHLSSICRCFSMGVPAILPYFTNQSRFPGFHLPPAALACNRIVMSAASMRKGTRVIRTISRRRRRPFCPFDNQLDRLQPLPQLRVVPETNAQQGLAVLFHEILGSSLPRFEDQPRFHITPSETTV